MDDRHQFFVIAKAGHNYRSLAAVRHSCLWGITTLRQCLHVLHIFSHSENRLALQQELRFAKEYFGDRPPPEPTPRESSWYTRFGPCPFPFITTCLMMGASLNPDTLHAYIVTEEPFGYPFDMGQSRHGITILDITDLDNVKYCFVHLAATNPESGLPCTPFQPLTGWQYIKSYYPEDDMNTERSMDLANPLEEKSLIDVQVLAETWPWGTWSDDRPALRAASPPSLRQMPRSLLEMSVEKVVDAIISSEFVRDFIAVRNTLEVLPNIQLLLKEPLLKRAKDVKTTPSLLLLALAYQGEHTLDLAPFTRLILPDIEYMLKSGSFSSVKTINLSGLLTPWCISKLSTVLSHLPALKTLCVLDKPGRPDDTLASRAIAQLTSLNPHLRLNKILISGLFSIPFRGIPWIPDMSHASSALPGFPSVQLLVYHRSEAIQERVAPYEHFSLGDALLNPARLVNIILRYCQILIANRYQMGGGTGYQLAVCIATASSTPGSSETGEIGVIPAQTYIYGKHSHHSSTAVGCYSDMRDLRPGQWTILMVRNLPRMGYGSPGASFDRGFMYAFLRCRSVILARTPPGEPIEIDEADLDVFSFEGFLRETCQFADPVDFESFLRPLREMSGRSHLLYPNLHDVLRCMSAREASHLLVKFMENIPNVDRAKEKTFTFA